MSKKRFDLQRFKKKKSVRTAGVVGSAAARTAGGLTRLAVKLAVSLLLVFLTAGLLFACIFAYYVKNTLATDLNITLEDYAISLSSTIWAVDK